jgi:Na+/melibiose symporter-like transporter
MGSARRASDWTDVLSAIGLVLAIVLEILFSGLLPDFSAGPFTRNRVMAMVVTALVVVVLIVVLNRLGSHRERLEREKAPDTPGD